MTKEEKERKIKLIALILIVQCEYNRRNPFKNAMEAIGSAVETLWWAKELNRVARHKTFEKGGLAFTGTEKEEIIAYKNNFLAVPKKTR